MIDEILDEALARMEKTIESVKEEFKGVRTGRASISMLDSVQVDYYGSLTPLNQLATLMTPDASLITVKPFDKTTMGDIEKSIMKANLGLNPVNDGEIIRIPVPALNEERRKKMVKQIAQLSENGKTAIRHIRRDTNDKLKALESDHSISEDQLHTSLDEVQEMTDENIKKLDVIKELKEKELMTV